MSYKIISTEVVDVTLRAKVEYTIDGKPVEATVDVFMPQTKTDVLTAIESREQTEIVKSEAKVTTEAVKVEVDKDISISVEE